MSSPSETRSASALSADMQPAGNPFATRHIRAGAREFRFEAGDSIRHFLQRLESANWRGQIVGPHGSGKTTLLRLLERHWPDADRDVCTFTLHGGQRNIPLRDWRSWNSRTIVMVDGFEQTSWLTKLRLLACCHHRGTGLLVTTHRRWRGLPVVQQTRTTHALLDQLVEELLKHEPALQLEQHVTHPIFDRCGGNVRETLMQLYDVAHVRQRQLREHVA